MNDQALIEQIKLRDQEAMVTLHSRYADLIFSIVYRVLDDASTAEEAVQDAFLRAWQNAAQFDAGRGPVVAWLIGIARNVAIDKLRQRNRRVKTVEDRSLDDAEELFTPLMPDDWRDRDRANNLRFAVQKLPPEQQQIIELSYYGGMSQSDIAEHLSLPLGTV